MRFLHESFEKYFYKNNQLMQDEHLKDFFLVGGTALSLRIGHRISIDIDLFSLTTKEEYQKKFWTEIVMFKN